MARKVTEIQQEIINTIQGDEVLSAQLTSTSKTAIWRLVTYAAAVSQWVVENLFDLHKAEVNTGLDSRLTHGDAWYVARAKAFQFGDAVNPLTGTYDIIDETKMVVNYASADDVNGQVIIKIATELESGLGPLPSDKEIAFNTYMEKQKDFGVKLIVRNIEGDQLRTVYDIYYDPTLMNANGMLLSNGTYPVNDTIRNFIKNLPFNGEFQPVLLTDALQVTNGVKVPVLKSAETKYAANDWAIVEAVVKPYSGYLTIADEFLLPPYLNYKPYDN